MRPGVGAGAGGALAARGVDLAEEVDRVLREDVGVEVKCEVELPRAALVQVPVLVLEGKSQLDDAEKVHVHLHAPGSVACPGRRGHAACPFT